MRSADDGVTWSRPVEITATFEQFRKDYDWKVIATGPAHGIRLNYGPHEGRRVVPVWLSLGTGGHAHRPSVVATIFSDDQGVTWKRGDIAVPDTPPYRWPNETVVVQLADGRVLFNSRSESDKHRRLHTISADGATGWSKPVFNDALLEPICMASILRVSRRPDADRNRIVFANPHNLDRYDGKAATGKSRDRRNLSVKLSYDEGKTWPVNRTLEAGYGAYSDLAMLPDGTILCFYEHGRASDVDLKKSTSYAGLTLARASTSSGSPAARTRPASSIAAILARNATISRWPDARLSSSILSSPRSGAPGRGSGMRRPSATILGRRIHGC
jgi:sialidase-1